MSLVLLVTTSVQALQLTWTKDAALGVPSEATFVFSGVNVIDGDVYLVGYARSGFAGNVWKKSGGSWTNLNLPNGSWLDDVTGTSSTDILVSGNSGRVMRYNGSSWSQEPIGSGDEMKRIRSTDALTAVTIGVNGARKLTIDGGANWTDLPGGTGGTQIALYANSASDIWVGGIFGGNGDVDHYNGTSWTTFAISPNSRINGISQGGGNTYAVGTGGEAFKLNAAGTTFEDMLYWGKNFTQAIDVFADSSGNAWIVGERATALHFDLDTGIYDTQSPGPHVNAGGFDNLSVTISPDGLTAWVVGDKGIWSAPVPEPPCESPFTADFNCDLIVDFNDFAVLSLEWLMSN